MSDHVRVVDQVARDRDRTILFKPTSGAGQSELPAQGQLTRHFEVVHTRVLGATRPAQCEATREYRRGECSGEMSRSEEHTSELQSLMRISYAVLYSNNTKVHNSI